jgi:hypothetical protein
VLIHNGTLQNGKITKRYVPNRYVPHCYGTKCYLRKRYSITNDTWYKTVHCSYKLVHVTKRHTDTKQYVAVQYNNIKAQYHNGLVGC